MTSRSRVVERYTSSWISHMPRIVSPTFPTLMCFSVCRMAITIQAIGFPSREPAATAQRPILVQSI